MLHKLNIVFRFLVLISGLELSTNFATHFQVQLFVDWICGLLGDKKENKKVSNIVQVLIAGKWIYIFKLKFVLNKKNCPLTFCIIFLKETVSEVVQ